MYAVASEYALCSRAFVGAFLKERTIAVNRAIAAGVTGLVCVMLTLGDTAAAAADSSEFGNVQQAISALAEADGVVGAIGTLYVDGKRLGQGSAGSRLLGGKGGKIPPDARYRIASQTKQMVATVAMQLVEEGKLGLDAKITSIPPELASQDLVELADKITVRQLIQHTAGIPEFIASGKFDVFDFTTYHPPVDLLKAARTQPRKGPVGEYHYSTTNYIVLGLIIEKVTDNTLSAELDRRVFDPVGMSRTYLPTRPPQGIEGPHGHGYAPDENGKPRDVDRLNASTWAVQGAVSTAHDVSAFQRAFTQGKLLPENLRQVIISRPEQSSGDAQNQQPGPVCGGEPRISTVAGGIPGLFAPTFSTADGRIQFAVSTTTAAPSEEIQQAAQKAAEAVICPDK